MATEATGWEDQTSYSQRGPDGPQAMQANPGHFVLGSYFQVFEIDDLSKGCWWETIGQCPMNQWPVADGVC